MSNKKYDFDEDIFEKCNTPEKAYWIGFIMADGCVYVTKKKGSVSYVLAFCINRKDEKLLDKFQGFLGSLYPYVHDKRNRVYLYVWRKKILEDLKQYGIIPRKTGKEQIKNIPKEYYPDFIRGYFDGDGCISNNKIIYKNKIYEYKSFRLCSASKGFLRQIQDILIRKCDLNKTKIYKVKNQESWQLAQCGKDTIKRIFNFLYENASIYLERKYTRWTG